MIYINRNTESTIEKAAKMFSTVNKGLNSIVIVSPS